MASIDINKTTEHIVYCSRCKTKLNKTSSNLRDCSNCKLHLYINPVTTNGAVLKNEKGEILLVKRKFDPKKGYWDIPGGFVDLGETIEESLRRELKEELGITIKDFKYLTSKIDMYEYRGINYQTLGTIFEGSISSKEKMEASDDIDGFKFFSIKNFPIDKLAFKSLEEFFKDYLFG